MWLFTIYGFYSVACLRNRKGELEPETVMVRARKRQHLQNLLKRFTELKKVKIEKWPGRDYGFRIVVPKELWARLVGELVMEQTWSNFKGATHEKNNDFAYNASLHSVWGTMLELQEGKPWYQTYKQPRNRVLPKGEAFDLYDPIDDLSGLPLAERVNRQNERIAQDLLSEEELEDFYKEQK